MSYFYLIYIDYDDFQKISSHSTSNSAGSVTKRLSEHSSITFNNKKLTVNPNCPMQLMLDYVCKEAGLNKDSDFDFATSKCTLLNIKSYRASTCGLEAIVPKETYFLVLTERDENGNRTKIIPLIYPNSKEYYELAVYLRKQSSTKQFKRSLSATSSTSSKQSIRSARLSGIKKSGSNLKNK